MQLADAKLFVVLGEKCRSGIKVVGTAERPCDKKFDEAMNSHEVQHLLQPMPMAQKSKQDGDSPGQAPSVRQTIQKKGGGKGGGKKGKTGRVWEAINSSRAFEYGLCWPHITWKPIVL